MSKHTLLPQVGQAIKKARKELGVSVKELCKECNVTPSHLSTMESAGRSPSLQVFLRIAIYLGIEVKDVA